MGEPINPAAWEWYYRVIGKERCPIVDTWWQTETGAILISPMPGAVPVKPGSAHAAHAGDHAEVVDFTGKPGGAGREGIPGHQAALAQHDAHASGATRSATRSSTGSRIPGSYFTGDAARRDEDGYFWILGRVDDVMNVSGHRLSTMEVESALVRHPAVAEAAVVGKPDEITGQAVCAFVTLKTGNWDHRRSGRGAAPVGGARDRRLRPARGDPLHRSAAQDAQRQDHAAPAARDRHDALGDGRRDDAGGHGRRQPAGGAARRGVELPLTSRDRRPATGYEACAQEMKPGIRAAGRSGWYGSTRTV